MKTNLAFRVVVPARYAATRLPGKPLADLAGEPMVQHVWRQAMRSDALEVVIATDDVRIQEVAQSFGAKVIMTAASHPSGTDRIAEVTQICRWPADAVVVNVQGDEPLLPPEVINQVAELLAAQPECEMATLCEPLTDHSELFDSNLVKVVSDERGRALYFSRAPVPWIKQAGNQAQVPLPADTFYRHLGIYAYRVGLLQAFTQWPVARLEQTESLEQLRILAKGVGIAVAPTCRPTPGGVDTEADLARIRAKLEEAKG